MAASAEQLPGDTGTRSFSTTFRGFDTAEVRAYLAQVEHERQALRDELDALRARTSGTPVLDEGTAAELLGEEAARLLTTAREGAAQIRAKAEENVARLLREAQDDAARTRADADIEVARRLNEASEQAAAEIEEAKRQGRELVFEAQALRTKMLEDVARRRRTARAQLEALRAGREELLTALDRAQDALGKVSGDVRAAAPELLEPPDASADAGAALADIEAGGPGMTFPAIPTVPSGVERSGLSLVLPLMGEKDDSATERPSLVPDRTPHRIDVSSLLEGPDAHDGDVDDAVDDPADDATEPPDVAELHGVDAEPHEVPERDADDVVRPTADDLFARIRADRERAVAGAREVLARDADADADADDGGDEPLRPAASGPDAEFLARRAEALGPLESALTHSLKRALADEQNQALDRLRRASGASTVDELVGTRAEQLDRFIAAARTQLHAALVAGVQSAGGGEAAAGGAESEVLAAVDTELVEPLRDRLERAVSDGGDADDELAALLRAAYREWKLQRLDSIATQLILVAHGRGTALGLPAGTPVRWVVDPAGPACPDADDNALAGAVPCGEAFPTGHTHAPAHPGCRCGLVRDDPAPDPV